MLGHLLAPASASIRAVGPSIAIGARARQIDGYRVLASWANADQLGAPQAERHPAPLNSVDRVPAGDPPTVIGLQRAEENLTPTSQPSMGRASMQELISGRDNVLPGRRDDFQEAADFLKP